MQYAKDEEGTRRWSQSDRKSHNTNITVAYGLIAKTTYYAQLFPISHSSQYIAKPLQSICGTFWVIILLHGLRNCHQDSVKMRISPCGGGVIINKLLTLFDIPPSSWAFCVHLPLANNHLSTNRTQQRNYLQMHLPSLSAPFHSQTIHLGNLGTETAVGVQKAHENILWRY